MKQTADATAHSLVVMANEIEDEARQIAAALRTRGSGRRVAPLGRHRRAG
jgi:hypothetical protein